MKKRAASASSKRHATPPTGGKPVKKRVSKAPALRAGTIKLARPVKRRPTVRIAASPSTAHDVIETIMQITGVRPILLESTLSSLAIVSRLQMAACAGELTSAFPHLRVPAARLAARLSAGTTIGDIVDIVRADGGDVVRPR